MPSKVEAFVVMCRQSSKCHEHLFCVVLLGEGYIILFFGIFEEDWVCPSSLKRLIQIRFRSYERQGKILSMCLILLFYSLKSR